ncbi:MAG: PorT family protein [Muribaculaceae bacterium]|nr:PorT family protein [Muribaculaceae bacterium]MDE6794890.1 PorT family protein [Muribaculaceae bacterium]
MNHIHRHIVPLGHLCRTIFIFIAIIASASTAMAKPGDKLLNRPYADLKRWHLGFSVGAHVQDLSFTHNGYVTPEGERWVAEVPDFAPGFCVNVLADLRLHKYLNLRFSPGMYFGSKNVVMIDYNGDLRHNQDVKSAYVVTPLDLKISGDRLRNVRPYVTLGAMGSFDVSKKRSEALLFNTADAYLCVGLGVDFYLPYFKLNPEIKFCFGLTDILRHERPDLVDDPDTFKMTQSLSKVKSNMVVISFYFE